MNDVNDVNDVDDVNNVIDVNDVNITWFQCSRCGVLSYQSALCKPCKSNIQLLYVNYVSKRKLTTLIDILIKILFLKSTSI